MSVSRDGSETESLSNHFIGSVEIMTLSVTSCSPFMCLQAKTLTNTGVEHSRKMWNLAIKVPRHGNWFSLVPTVVFHLTSRQFLIQGRNYCFLNSKFLFFLLLCMRLNHSRYRIFLDAYQELSPSQPFLW